MRVVNLLTAPWIPTPDGPVTLTDVWAEGSATGRLTSGRPLADAALLRLLGVMHARAHGDPQRYLQQHEVGLQLHDLTRPFMQVPAAWTDALPETPVHALTLCHATGRDATLLGGTLDSSPRAVSAADAVLDLLTYHAFAPSRGVTRFHYSKDAPLARVLTFHAHGATLQDTLALNAPPVGPTPPTWERAPDWQAWRQADPIPLDATTVHAWPWRSATLVPDGTAQVRAVKLASGPVPTAAPEQLSLDAHALQSSVPEADHVRLGRAYEQRRNPPSREGRRALVDALRQTLLRDPLAPLGFRHALTQGAQRVSVTGLSTRPGQPVILGVIQAELPWPTIAPGDAAALLTVVQEQADALERVLYVRAKTEGRTRQDVQAAPDLRVYWENVWPYLSGALVGAVPADTFLEISKSSAVNA